MGNSALESTLVEVTDGLRSVSAVHLVGLHPHPSARDSFVAEVDVEEPGAAVALRLIAEDIYRTTGALVLFHCECDSRG
jgi:hypothetical protein